MPDNEPWRPDDTFGARLLLIRHQRGMTQRDAAEACGLDDGSWSNWESGTRPRDKAEVVRAIYKGLGVDPDWLMWGSVNAVSENACSDSPDQLALDLDALPILAGAAA